jgi:hypothetical protein
VCVAISKYLRLGKYNVPLLTCVRCGDVQGIRLRLRLVWRTGRGLGNFRRKGGRALFRDVYLVICIYIYIYVCVCVCVYSWEIIPRLVGSVFSWLE